MFEVVPRIAPTDSSFCNLSLRKITADELLAASALRASERDNQARGVGYSKFRGTDKV